MSYADAIKRHAESFSSSDVHAEATWDYLAKTDAHLVLGERTLHLYCNSGSRDFEDIIDGIAASSSSESYDIRLVLKPPTNTSAKWSREMAAELLISPGESKFSFIRGKRNGYGTIDAYFSAYKDKAKSEGVIVSLHMSITNTSTSIPKEVFGSRK